MFPPDKQGCSSIMSFTIVEVWDQPTESFAGDPLFGSGSFPMTMILLLTTCEVSMYPTYYRQEAAHPIHPCSSLQYLRSTYPITFFSIIPLSQLHRSKWLPKIIFMSRVNVVSRCRMQQDAQNLLVFSPGISSSQQRLGNFDMPSMSNA